MKIAYTPFKAKFYVDSESGIRYMCYPPTLSRYLHKQHIAPMWPSCAQAWDLGCFTPFFTPWALF